MDDKISRRADSSRDGEWNATSAGPEREREPDQIRTKNILRSIGIIKKKMKKENMKKEQNRPPFFLVVFI